MQKASMSLQESIANLVLDTFASLPRKCLPRSLPDGGCEWTPLSAIVLSRPQKARANSSLNDSSHLAHGRHNVEVKAVGEIELQVVALATGTKSLPTTVLPKCDGLVLHDSHAEILALRSFNYWLLCEIELVLLEDRYDSAWVDLTPASDSQETHKRLSTCSPFHLRPDVEISLFSTTAPCGDASMELVMQDLTDTSPWSEENIVPGLPLGRGHFSKLGVLRRKPARGDAQISMSKSCTDKLMLTQLVGCLRFPADLFLNSRETHLRRMIVYAEEYTVSGYGRSFDQDGRLKSLTEKQDISCTFFDVDILPTHFRSFSHNRPRSKSDAGSTQSKVCNFSMLWIAGYKDNAAAPVVEILINGVKQGFKQSDSKLSKGSVVCRRKLLDKALHINTLLVEKEFASVFGEAATEANQVEYSVLKDLPQREWRQKVIRRALESLGGWPNKTSIDDFSVSLHIYRENLPYVLHHDAALQIVT